MATLLEKCCVGCGSKLGRKRYKFGALWKIPGIYCKECMEKLTKGFEESTTGGLTLPKHKCSLCNKEFYFLRNMPSQDYKHFCNSCFDAVINGMPVTQDIPSTITQDMPPRDALHTRLPKSIYFAGATSIIIMAVGLVLTLTNMESGKEFSFFLGSITALLGVVLLRKFMRLTKRLVYTRGSKESCK